MFATKLESAPENAVFASYLIRVRPNRKVDPIFLSHFFNSSWYWDQITSKSVGAAQPGVNATKLESLEVPLPALSEQRRIAAILDQADALRAKRRTALAQLDEMAQALFVEMFSDPGSNPRGWPSAPLSALARAEDTINYGVIQPGDDYENGIPIVRVGDLTEGRVSHQKLKKIDPAIDAAYKRSRLRGDEILISCVGSIGIVALTSATERGFNIARAIARVRVHSGIHREYVAAFLRSSHVQNYFENELRTVSQPTLNIKQICETRILVPPFELQEKFLAQLSALEMVASRLKKSQDELELLFSSLQHRAFRGEL